MDHSVPGDPRWRHRARRRRHHRLLRGRSRQGAAPQLGVPRVTGNFKRSAGCSSCSVAKVCFGPPCITAGTSTSRILTFSVPSSRCSCPAQCTITKPSCTTAAGMRKAAVGLRCHPRKHCGDRGRIRGVARSLLRPPGGLPIPARRSTHHWRLRADRSDVGPSLSRSGSGDAGQTTSTQSGVGGSNG